MVPDLEQAASKEAAKDLTLKQVIELHREKRSCASCHQKIDPWGLPFEQYGAEGHWRESRVVGTGRKRREVAVEASATLPDGQTVDGMQSLKKYLLTSKTDQITLHVVSMMAEYALGRSVGFGDRGALKQIADNVRSKGYGMRDVVLELVTSELFSK